MAQIQLDPDYNPTRLAVKNNQVYLRVTDGWDLTDLKDEYKVVDYDEIKQKYTFNFYTNSGKTTKIIEKTGATNNIGEIDVILYGLTKGAKNSITVSISYSYKVRYWQNSADTSDWGNWSTKTNSNSNTDTLDIFTTNDKNYDDFWTNTDGDIPAKGNYIYQHITKTNVNNWMEQLGIWSSWYHQDDYYIKTKTNSTGNTYKEVSVPNINNSGIIPLTTPTVNSDITAAWYKNCGNACGLSGMNNIKGLSTFGVLPKDATYITAQHFKDLAKAVTTWT